jgi:hypothetical protein
MEASYTPVAYEFKEVIDEQIAKKTSGKIFFWSDGKLEEVKGVILRQEEIPGKGVFIVLDSGKSVRIDRIITLFGKPGSAFEEYEAFSRCSPGKS